MRILDSVLGEWEQNGNQNGNQNGVVNGYANGEIENGSIKKNLKK
jgi:hypothetical protein